MKFIPYGHQWIDEKDIEEVICTLKSDWLTQGPKIREFEEALCNYTGAKYSVTVSSGTAALHCAAIAAGIINGDEVITSPITFAASANCVLYCGGKPVFAEIESDTVNANPQSIENLISDKTKAVIAVHFSGHPCNLNKIFELAEKYGLIIIEDAAHALGAKYRTNNYENNWFKIGSCAHSNMTILSFHPVKHITTGEGGAILTNSEELYKKLLMIRTHGITNDKLVFENEDKWYYEMQLLGYNYRFTDIQAALGISQLKKLDKFVKRRRDIVKRYDNAFSGNQYFDLPVEKDYAFSSYHLYVIQLKSDYYNTKSQIFSNLRKEGIGVQVHYIPVYFHPYYRQSGYEDICCPIAEDYYRRAISLPLYPLMDDSDTDQVINTVYKVFKSI